jgi:hypothetical protein
MITYGTLEKRRVSQVAREYEEKGYTVTKYPKKEDLPTFLANYSPDLIATHEEGNFVIEITSSATLATSDTVLGIANTVQEHPNWTFELVVTNPRQPKQSGADFELLYPNEISLRIAEARRLANDRINEAALLLMWSAVEGALRNLGTRESPTIRDSTVQKIMKTLVSLGAVSKTDHKTLQKGFKMRNAVAHGYSARVDSVHVVEQLGDLAEKILRQIERMPGSAD